MKPKVHHLLLITSAAGMATFMSSCKSPAPAAQTGGAVPVVLDSVTLQEAAYFDLYPGNVVALNEVELRSEVSGFITGIHFKEGQPVRKGQKLYEIEQSKYAAAYAQSNASLEVAKANLEKAQNDADRYARLGDQGMATKQKVEYAQTDLKNASMQVAAAKADLSRAATDLSHASIIAPFDGTIGISLVKRGTFISAGQTLLNSISSDNPMAVDFVISEKEIGRFNALKDKKLSPKDSLFTLVLADKTVYPSPGQIELFDRAVDPQTGTLKVRLQFPNTKHLLKSGMSCNVRVQNKNPQKLPLIPFKAVTEQMGEFYVYVIEKDTARQHKVVLGTSVRDKIIIQSGLNSGDKIVVEGVQKLKDGVAVQTGTPQQPAAATSPSPKK